MKQLKKRIATLLSLTLLMTSMPTQMFATSVTNPLSDMSRAQIQTTTGGAIQVTTPGAIQVKPVIYEGDGFEVEFQVKNWWNNQFEGALVLKNTGEETIENWSLGFDFEHEITNIWETQIVEYEGTRYTLKNVGWNQDIEPGQAIVMPFIAKYEESIKVPERYDILVAQQEATGYEIDFKVMGDWGSGFNAEISITNTSEEPIEDWQLEFDFDRKIDSFWTAQIISHEGDHYVVKNDGYNANINPRQTIKLGFSGTPGKVVDGPTDYILKSLVQGEEVDIWKDTDNDDLTDSEEKEIGSDINNPDTDGDGLPDGYEYWVLDTSPIEVDTDEDGIMDPEEDLDQDMLSNLEEYQLDTNPFDDDTDDDFLLDGKEVKEYGTDPLVFDPVDMEKDSDGDGIADDIEIRLGSDRYSEDSDGDGLP